MDTKERDSIIRLKCAQQHTSVNPMHFALCGVHFFLAIYTKIYYNKNQGNSGLRIRNR